MVEVDTVRKKAWFGQQDVAVNSVCALDHRPLDVGWPSLGLPSLRLTEQGSRGPQKANQICIQNPANLRRLLKTTVAAIHCQDDW